MYVIRLLSATGDSLLSAILHAEGGEFEEGAVDFWQARQKRALLLPVRPRPFAMGLELN